MINKNENIFIIIILKKNELKYEIRFNRKTIIIKKIKKKKKNFIFLILKKMNKIIKNLKFNIKLLLY